MKDTTPKMWKKQLEIMMAMTPEERFAHGMDMIDSAYNMVKERILKKSPGLKGKKLALHIFLEYYRNDFNQQELNRIIEYFQK